LAWDVDLDYVATDTFVGILALICTNAVALITAILYYSSLKEQQKQTFNSQWQGMLERHLRIRDEQKLAVDVIENDGVVKEFVTGYHCFAVIWITYLRLAAAIKLNVKFSWSNIYMNMKMRDFYKDAWENIEFETQSEYESKKKTSLETNLIEYVGYLYDITTNIDDEPYAKAFDLISRRYFKGTSIYFTHLHSILRFLERQEHSYEVEDCKKSLNDVMTKFEKEVVFLYGKFNNEYRELIDKYISL
jgi:hypothetical protein